MYICMYIHIEQPLKRTPQHSPQHALIATMSLPVVDLSPFLEPSSVEAKRTAASALDSACRAHGFFYLSHHGIPAPLEDRVLSAARDFFLNSTVPEKLSILRRDPGKGGDGARGYQRLSENVTQGHADYHEAIDFYRSVPAVPFDPADLSRGYQLLRGQNLWPEKPAEFKEVFEQYWQRLRELGGATMKAMAWALGYEDDEDVLLRDTEQGFWVARVIGYPPLNLEVAGEGVSCGVHTGA
jgi:isopenicillin N synthase-like dioxygenase